MKHYTTAQLSLASTYEQDRALATLARKVATNTYDAEAKGTMALGEWKKLLLSGGCPDLIAAELNARRVAEEQEKARALALQSLLLPRGYSCSLEGTLVFIQGPFHDLLNAEIKSLGGHWHGQRKAWGIPISQGQRLAAAVPGWGALLKATP